MGRFPKNDIIALVGEAPRFDLAESVSPILTLDALLGAAPGSVPADLPLGYGTAQGDPRLRAAIAARHGVGPDDVVVTVGGAHALFLVAFVLCGGGGAQAVAATPLFPAARAGLQAVGAQVSDLRLTFDGGYQPDLADLRRLLSPRTRLVSLASPQNPSGVAIPPATLRGVLAVMDEICPDAHLLVDETYREAAYGDDPVADSAVALDRRVIAIASLSKCHGAPGLRIGWAITRDAALREDLVLGKFNTVVSCSPLDEALALAVLDEARGVLDPRRRHLAEGLARVAEWVQGNSALVDWVRPDAGAIACIRLKPAPFDAVAMRRFHEEIGSAGVRLASGAWFGDEERVFRLGFGLLTIPELELALDALTGALRRSIGPGAGAASGA